MRYVIIIVILAATALIALDRERVARGITASCERAVGILRDGKAGIPSVTHCASAVQ